MPDCKTACAGNCCGKHPKETPPPATPHLLLMVAHKALHDAEDKPWRCRLCDDMGRHDDEGIDAHLEAVHKVPRAALQHDRRDGEIFVPVAE